MRSKGRSIRWELVYSCGKHIFFTIMSFPQKGIFGNFTEDFLEWPQLLNWEDGILNDYYQKHEDIVRMVQPAKT